MIIIIKRVWNSVGIWGALIIITALVEIYVLIFRPSSDGPGVSLITIPVFVAGLVRFTSQMRGYRRLQATKSYDDIGKPLRDSAEEFGLVLRPFGADGETFLRQYETTRKGKKRLKTETFSANLTMEQVFAVSAQKAVKQKVYALVDPGRKLAPPGPVYVKVDPAEWESAVGNLVQRAYVVFIWLPAGQDVRPGLSTEVEQIVQAGLQKRTIIVLPSPDKKAAHQRAVEQAARLLAAMETAEGKVEQADPLRRQHYEGLLGDRAITMRFATGKDGTGMQLAHRMVANRRPLTWQRVIRNVLLCWLLPVYIMVFADQRRNSRVNAWTYEESLVKHLSAIRSELAGQSFSDRYPGYEPGATAETVAGRRDPD